MSAQDEIPNGLLEDMKLLRVVKLTHNYVMWINLMNCELYN